jgi:hypothetical protein
MRGQQRRPAQLGKPAPRTATVSTTGTPSRAASLRRVDHDAVAGGQSIMFSATTSGMSSAFTSSTKRR